MKIFWIACLVILILMIVLLGIYILIGFFSHKMCLSRNGRIRKKIAKNYVDNLKENNIDENYFNEYKKIIINSVDGLKLCGFYKNNNSNKLAILSHGYGGNHLEMANFASIFEKRGYDILAIDHRCHGQSEGIEMSMGEKESKDLLLWIDKMIEINPQYKIVLFGLSMGASIVCITGGEKLPANVVLMIEDCGYDNLNNQFKSVYFKSKLSNKFVYNLFSNFVKKTKGFDLAKVDACKSLKNCKLPVLFIHGENDTYVPTGMMYNMAKEIPQQRCHIYLAEGAGHAQSYTANPKKYENEINKFLSKYYM